MIWKPAKTLGLIVGLIIVLTIVGVGVFLLQGIVGKRLDLNLYLTALLFVFSLPLLALWIYWYCSLLTLRYYLDRNGLVIVCGTFRHIIPIHAIRRVVSGHEVTATQGFRGIGWPGYLMGRMRLKGLGRLVVNSTEPLSRQLIVVTDTVCYGISPQNTAQFLEDLASRRALGPTENVEQTTTYSWLASLPAWRDRWFWAIMLTAVVANAALFGLVISRYSYLPDRIPLHLNAQGEVDRIASKTGLLVVPAIGTLTLLLNGTLSIALHRRERLEAYLSVIVALGIQAILWIAINSILRI